MFSGAQVRLCYGRRVTIKLCVFLLVTSGFVGCAETVTPSAQKVSAPLLATRADCDAVVSLICANSGGGESVECQASSVSVSLLPSEACAEARKHAEYIVDQLKARGELCATLRDRLCADLGRETGTCSLVRESTEGFPKERCRAMLASYDQVLEELEELEAANQPLSPERRAALLAGDPPAVGPSDAKVVIVEFSDFQCPYCSRAAATAKAILDKYPAQVRFVFRHLPLDFHQHAALAAEAALAAHAQGKYREMHDLLFANQNALEPGQLVGYAEQLGLDLPQFKEMLDNGTHKAKIEADRQLAQETHVVGTPTWFLNGVRLDNPTDLADTLARIEAEL